jgi:uncharacterized protein
VKRTLGLRKSIATSIALIAALVIGPALLIAPGFADQPVFNRPLAEPARESRDRLRFEALFNVEQAELSILERKPSADNALALARRFTGGILVSAGNPLRIERPDRAIETLLPYAGTGGETGTAIRVLLGKLLLGRNAPGDSERGLALIEKAAAEASPAAQYELALILERGQHAPRDPARAAELHRLALAGGDIRAFEGLIRLTPDSSARADFERRRLFALSGASRDSGPAAAALSAILAEGKLAPFDPERAASLASDAVRLGMRDSAFALHQALLIGPELPVVAERLEASALRQAAFAGAIDAARALAVDFAELDRFGIDEEEARFWFEALAGIGDIRGIFLYAKTLREGRKLRPDHIKADRIFAGLMVRAKADPELAHRFAQELLPGSSPFRDPPLVETLLEIAAEAKVANAARDLAAVVLFEPSVARPEQEARMVALLEREHEARDGRSTALLARAFAEGKGTAHDPKKALSLLDGLIARTPSAEAFLARGRLFARHGGADQPLALPDLEQAASLGSAQAMLDLSRLYRLGRAVPKNEANARSWLEKAIALGSTPALKALGDMLAEQPGNEQRAAELYRLGWRAGDSEAGLALAEAQIKAGKLADARMIYVTLSRTDIPLGKAAFATFQARNGAPREALKLIREAERAIDKRPFVLEFVAARMLDIPDTAIVHRGATLLAGAALQGNANAAEILASAYREGKGVPRDLALSENFAERAARQGRTGFYRDLGHDFAIGDGVPADSAKARAIRLRAAELEPDNPHARFDLARMLLDGDGGPRDPVAGARELIAAVRLGHLGAQLRMARQILDGDASLGDASDAIALLDDAARRGATEAALLLGRALSSGEAGFVDRDRALFWYRKAAEAGSAEARIELARRLFSDEDGVRDEDKALSALAALGKAGLGEADAERARYYFATADGADARERQAKGLDALRAAAEAGEAEAMFQISVMYERGQLLPKSADDAAFWLERAAKAGHAFAKTLLEPGGATEDDDAADEPPMTRNP